MSIKIFQLLFFILFSTSQLYCQLRPVPFNKSRGTYDTNAPSALLTTSINDPVLTSSVLTYCTFTKGPISGLTSGDFTLVNCTISSFTQVSGSQNLWTFYINPVIDGAFSVQLGASTCSWNGINNTASNLLSKTYDSGTSYDLQNRSELSTLQHYRGHVAAFTECNDFLNSTSVSGMELLMTKNNKAATMFGNGTNQFVKDMFNFGRCDFGVISFSYSDYLTKEPLITDVRSGIVPDVMSYKNGDVSYASSLPVNVLYGRNSSYENVNTTLRYQYSGFTPTDLISSPSTFRFDYYGKTTGTDYYVGAQPTGDSRLATYVSQVISGNGWFTNFVHWHWQVADYPDHYLSQLTSNIGATDVYNGSVNTVAEYYYVRESVDNLSASGNVITVTHTKDWPTIPYSKIQTPLWVKLNTTGTVFAGHDIAISSGLRVRKISSNVFYIPIILDFSGSSSTVSIGITTAPDYVNLNTPVISRTGNSVTIDQPSKITIWRIQKPTTLTTSGSSVSIPNSDNATVNMTVPTGLTIAADTEVRVYNDASHYFMATVISYSSVTGILSLSSSSSLGSGTFSSWTIQNYYHMKTATVVERNFSWNTSYTIAATLDETNYTYYVGAITKDGQSAVIP